ncbi:hypothetical protein TNIN_392931 [Trichonephila inaurata madagascariensis]|uniref:Uncharacterized protein n=1 Tax=Trichonephila inaurata madagascariensis TaxID=2747483 RepID=A0A8X6X205_9ARAC|nr:hypothetical protein TNIN_392931 [Trichonephila inaurata madagascariensis]
MVWCIKLETTWCSNLDHLDSIGSSGVDGCYRQKWPDRRISSARRVSNFASARCTGCEKDALRPCVSHTLPPTLDERNTLPLCRAPNPLRTP